jgi:hypothetical protein
MQNETVHILRTWNETVYLQITVIYFQLKNRCFDQGIECVSAGNCSTTKSKE